MLQGAPANRSLEDFEAQREPSISPTAHLLGAPVLCRASGGGSRAFARLAAVGRPLLCGLSPRAVLGVALAVVPLATGTAAVCAQRSTESRQRGVNHDCYASYRGAASS